MFAAAMAAVGLLALAFPSSAQGQLEGKVEVPAPAPSGMPWDLAHARSSLVDDSRKDPYNNSTNRKIAFSVFMPIAKIECTGHTFWDYMPNQTASASNLQFFGNEEAGVFDQLKFQSCSETVKGRSYNTNHFPLLIFEPAVGTSRFLYNQLASQLSANGAHVVTIDHPYDAPVVEFEGSDAIKNDGRVNLDPFQVNKPVDDAGTKKAIDTRIADVNAVIKHLEKPDVLPELFPYVNFTKGNTQIPTQRIFMIGHGLGGSVATDMGAGDKRVEWTVNLSGSTRTLTEDITAYTIFFGREGYRSEDDVAWQKTRKHLTGPQAEWTYNKAEQFDYSDLPLVANLVDSKKKPQGLGTPYENMNPDDPTTTFRAVSCFLEVRCLGDCSLYLHSLNQLTVLNRRTSGIR